MTPSPDLVFQLGNALALLGWLALAVSAPKRSWTPRVWQLTGMTIPLVFALGYVSMLIGHWGPGGFGSLAEVRQLFDRPGLLAAGWLHYLAFDLFMGTWIARRAGELGIAHVVVLPVLVLTFLFGPAGLLAFAALRLLVRGRAS